MERRKAKIIVGAAGGTAAKGAKTYKIALPNAWVRAMGADSGNAELVLSFDGEAVTITRAENAAQFVRRRLSKKHLVRELRFYDADSLCSTIYADFTSRELLVENSAVELPKTAFGSNTMPEWPDFEAFLESRCIPRSRAGCREYLETLGLYEYDALAIIQKTQGRMAQDEQWLEIKELA